MKMIKAIIRPERFDFVKKALEDNGIFGMTVMEVMGRGEQKGISLHYRGGPMLIELLPKLNVEVIVKDSQAEEVLQLISNAAKTGKIGDGKIFLVNIEKTIRIRTDETEV